MRIYSVLKDILSQRARHRLGRSELLRPFRDAFFRPNGTPEIVGGLVTFESVQFRFSAPYQTYVAAKQRGIESTICRIIMANCRRDAVCFDVGANYGFITTIMALRIGEGGRVVAIEPVPRIFATLLKNIEDNGFQDFATPLQKAVGERNGRMAMDMEDRFDQRASIHVTAIDDIYSELKLNALDLLKIDVDGTDHEVLVGAKKTIVKHKPILIVETCNNQSEIYHFLRACGYEFVTGMRGEEVTIGDWPPNLVASMEKLRFPSRGSF